MKVHSVLGNGFQEVIYQRCLAPKQGLIFTRELDMSIFYEGVDVGTGRVDFLVEDKVMVEIKAVTGLENVHFAQALNYLEAYKLEIGLLKFWSFQFKVSQSYNRTKVEEAISQNC